MSNANYIGRNALCIALPKFTPGSWALIYVNFGVVIYSPGGKLPGGVFLVYFDLSGDGQAAHHSLNETSMTMQSSQAKSFTDGGMYQCHVGLQAGTLQ